jgi:hypothetical protein
MHVPTFSPIGKVVTQGLQPKQLHNFGQMTTMDFAMVWTTTTTMHNKGHRIDLGCTRDPSPNGKILVQGLQTKRRHLKHVCNHSWTMDNNGHRNDLDDDEDDAQPWTSQRSGMHAPPLSPNCKIFTQGLQPSKLVGSRIWGNCDHNQILRRIPGSFNNAMNPSKVDATVSITAPYNKSALNEQIS